LPLCIAICAGSGLWQLIASWLSWPVAGTHCIIFGLLGFTVAAKGMKISVALKIRNLKQYTNRRKTTLKKIKEP
jgi:phosphate/sulfate permease